jgi:hypothetical protein
VETDKIEAERARQAAVNAEKLQRQIAANLGPSAGTADADFIARLAADAGKGKKGGYGAARKEPTTRQSMDHSHQEQMKNFWKSQAEAKRKSKPTKAPSPPPAEAAEAASASTDAYPTFHAASAKVKVNTSPIKAKSPAPQPIKSSPPPQPPLLTGDFLGILDPSQQPIPTRATPYDYFNAETRDAAIRRVARRMHGRPPHDLTRPLSAPPPKARVRSRSAGKPRSAGGPEPTLARSIEKGEPNDLQVEASRRRLASKTKQTPQPPPKPAKAPPAKPPSPSRAAAPPAKPSTPPPAKATAAASAYPTMNKAAAKVAAKTPTVVKNAAAASAPQGRPPSEKHVAGPKSADMGPEAMRSTDPDFWLTLSKGVLHDQLSQRGHINKLTTSAFAKLTKPELVKLILALPPPPKKP